MATRDELVAVAGERYRRGSLHERGRILDEFTALTGLHRKHAMRLLRSNPRSDRHGARPERRIYGEAVREALIIVNRRRKLTPYWSAPLGVDRLGVLD
jgi:hypothetical protein